MRLPYMYSVKYEHFQSFKTLEMLCYYLFAKILNS